jgi:dolichol-phosphate mannosyltransferase
MAAAERVMVIVPTYDERENLPRIVAAIFDAQPDVHVLVVDDASPDGTGELAEQLAAADPRIGVLHRAGKQGLGRAYLDAFVHVLAHPAGYTHVVQIDADLSHDPRAIAGLRQACRDGADVALGSRWIPGGGAPGWPLGRRLLSQGGSRYAALVLGAGVRDLTGGFKCWRRAVLEALPLGDVITAGYGFQIEMTVRALRLGFRVVEVPITFTDRTLGHSKMSGAIVQEALLGVWRLRGKLPRR